MSKRTPKEQAPDLRRRAGAALAVTCIGLSCADTSVSTTGKQPPAAEAEVRLPASESTLLSKLEGPWQCGKDGQSGVVFHVLGDRAFLSSELPGRLPDYRSEPVEVVGSRTLRVNGEHVLVDLREGNKLVLTARTETIECVSEGASHKRGALAVSAKDLPSKLEGAWLCPYRGEDYSVVFYETGHISSRLPSGFPDYSDQRFEVAGPRTLKVDSQRLRVEFVTANRIIFTPRALSIACDRREAVLSTAH